MTNDSKEKGVLERVLDAYINDSRTISSIRALINKTVSLLNEVSYNLEMVTTLVHEHELILQELRERPMVHSRYAEQQSIFDVSMLTTGSLDPKNKPN